MTKKYCDTCGAFVGDDKEKIRHFSISIREVDNLSMCYYHVWYDACSECRKRIETIITGKINASKEKDN